MADSFTGNINLRKPEVGAANDTWGGIAGLNGDLDIIDAIFLATGLSTVAPPAGHPLEGVPGVGLRIGKGMVLNVEGQVQVKDPTDVTKVGTLSSDLIPTGTTVDLKYPAAGGTIATVEVATAMATAVHPVGTILSGYYFNTAPSGYVLANGLTIGDASSLATNRAHADCERLFLHFWNHAFTVVGGRGASAAADWAAHKQLVLPNHSGRVMAGRDNLSGTAANVLPGFTYVGMPGGADRITLTTAEMPVHAHNITDAGHVHAQYDSHYFYGGIGDVSVWTIDNAVGPGPYLNMKGRATTALGYAGIGGTHNAGSSTAHNNIQPTIAVDVIIAL